MIPADRYYPLDFEPGPSGILTYGRDKSAGFFARLFGVIQDGLTSFSRILDKIAIAYTRRYTEPQAKEVQEGLVEEAAQHIAGVLTLSDLYGRGLVIEATQAEKAKAGDHSPAQGPYPTPAGEPPPAPAVPRIPFADAIEDLSTRIPVLAFNATDVAHEYQTRHAFAMARSAELATTDAVRRHMGKALQDGLTVEQGAAQILEDLQKHERSSEMRGINRAYAETVFRTNAATAFTAGTFRQATQGEAPTYFPALERQTTHDASARDNHLAADKLLAATNDPIWEIWAPPSGYNCRCHIRLVSRYELQERGRLLPDGRVIPFYPPGIEHARPDDNFGQGSIFARFLGRN